LGAGARIGGAKIYWRGLDSGFKCDVETSDDLSSLDCLTIVVIP
jgi:hypothetical protein